MDAVPRETQVLVRIVPWTGLDDDRGAVFARAKVAEVSSVQETLDCLGVGPQLGTWASAAAVAGCGRFLT